jgi:hypothetical protein
MSNYRKGSTEGPLWVIFIYWTIFGYEHTLNALLTNHNFKIAYIIGSFVIWALWLWGSYMLFNIIKSIFKSKK